MIEALRLKIYSPKLIFHNRDIKIHDRDVLTRMEGNFHCLYKLPNSLVPRLHSRIILTTKQIGIVTSRYDEGAIFNLSDFESVKIEEGFLRMYTGDVTIDIELGNSEGESFAEIVLDSWEDIRGEFTTDLSDEDAQHVEQQIESLREREKEENSDS